MSRIGLALLFVVCATIGVATQRVAAAPFDDLANHWAKSAVERLSTKQIIPPATDGKFNPDQPITTQELRSWLERTLHPECRESAPSSAPPILKKEEPVTGKSPTIKLSVKYFEEPVDPLAPIRRGDALCGFGKALGVEEPDEGVIDNELANYSDGYDVPDSAKSGVAALCKAGIYVGSPGDNSVRPNDMLTRAEAAALLDRLSSYSLQHSIDAAVAAVIKGLPPENAEAGETFVLPEAALNEGRATDAGAEVIIPAGTVFSIKLDEGLDSSKDKRGEYRVASTTSAVRVNGMTIEEGATFRERITSVVSARRCFGAPGRIEIHFDQLEVPGLFQAFPVAARLDTARIKLTEAEKSQRRQHLIKNAKRARCTG